MWDILIFHEYIFSSSFQGPSRLNGPFASVAASGSGSPSLAKRFVHMQQQQQQQQ